MEPYLTRLVKADKEQEEQLAQLARLQKEFLEETESVPGDLAKAAKEGEQLRNENNRLKVENQELRERIGRYEKP